MVTMAVVMENGMTETLAKGFESLGEIYPFIAPWLGLGAFATVAIPLKCGIWRFHCKPLSYWAIRHYPGTQTAERRWLQSAPTKVVMRQYGRRRT
jgi:hypothetical protein